MGDVADRLLIPWGNGHVDIDDDLLRPTTRSIRAAALLCRRFRDAGERPPTAVLPDGDGGILFEHRAGRASTQVNVLHGGESSGASTTWRDWFTRRCTPPLNSSCVPPVPCVPTAAPQHQ